MLKLENSAWVALALEVKQSLEFIAVNVVDAAVWGMISMKRNRG